MDLEQQPLTLSSVDWTPEPRSLSGLLYGEMKIPFCGVKNKKMHPVSYPFAQQDAKLRQTVSILVFSSTGADVIEVGAAEIHGPSEQNPLFRVARDYGLLAPEALTEENQSMDVSERPPMISNWFSSSGTNHGADCF